MPRKAANIPANETNAQRFVRLANMRVNQILTNFKGLGWLGNKAQYESKPEQITKIKTTLQESLDRAIQQMSKGETTSEFKL